MKKILALLSFCLCLSASAYLTPLPISAQVVSADGTNGLSLTGGIMYLAPASTSVNGAITSTDWNTFNAKEPAQTKGTIRSTSSQITISGGTSSTVGPGVTVSVSTASGSVTGLLISTDWNTFNGKQASLSMTQAPSLQLSFGSGAIVAVTSGAMIGTAKIVRTATLENLEAAALGLTCTSNPVVDVLDCGTSAGTCYPNAVMGSVTVTALNTQTDGGLSGTSVAAGHYLALEFVAGACTALNLHGSVGYKMQ